MVIWLLLLFALQVNALGDDIIQDGGIVTLSLKNYNKTNEYDYKRVTLYKNASISIHVNELPDYLSFVVIQVHTYQYPITLKYTSQITSENNINGTNVGLVQFTNLKSSLIFYLNNENNRLVDALIIVVGYTQKSPVPGGCAMESPTEIAPYLDLNYTDSVITVKAGPSSLQLNDSVCDQRIVNIRYAVYQMILPEWDFTEETYFTSILSMIAYEDVIHNGYMVHKTVGGTYPYQTQYSSYRGIGRVITIVASSPTGDISVYVPTFSYACDITYGTATCGFMMTTFAKVENALLAFIGLFICFKGHRYFLINQFVMGTLTGSIISYILLLRNLTMEIDYMMIATAIGMVFGVIWTSTWWCFRSPILSVIVPLFNLAVCITVIIYSSIGDVIPIFESDVNYWAIFFSVVLTFFLTSLLHPMRSSILSSCFVGACLVIIPISISVGSIIPYSFINVIRRATVPGFNLVNTELFYQTPDILLCVSILLLFLLGQWRQTAQARNRPPFPPIPAVLRRDNRTTNDDEHTSLMADANYPNYTLASESTTVG